MLGIVIQPLSCFLQALAFIAHFHGIPYHKSLAERCCQGIHNFDFLIRMRLQNLCNAGSHASHRAGETGGNSHEKKFVGIIDMFVKIFFGLLRIDLGCGRLCAFGQHLVEISSRQLFILSCDDLAV